MMSSSTVIDAPGTLFIFGAESSQRQNETVLLFHGFPGDDNKQNEDLASHLSLELKIPTFVLHYRGLGRAPGRFSFAKTLEEGKQVFKYLCESQGFQKVHLVGHSWGGLVTLNLLRNQSAHAGQIALLSPLSQLPGPDTVRQVIAEFSAKAEFFATKSVADIFHEVEGIRINHEPINFAEHLQLKYNQMLIIQAANDEEVPPAVNRALAAKLGLRARYLEIRQGHKFLENRKELFKLVLDHIRGDK